ncbi:MAG TPA: hypothetical protein VJA27_02265 [Patescibacteria group bacterium]|nr:hypothetical protein [Patescibacteria group bacterium]
MRRPNLDQVEIVEPPIGELTKKKHGFLRTCLTSCGCVVFLIIALIVGLRLFIGPGPQELKTPPENFPSNIPVYDKDNIERVTYISARYKTRGVQIASLFPKIILSPLLLSDQKQIPETNQGLNKKINSAKEVWSLATTPVTDNRDTIQIEWRNLDTEPSFIASYYRTELRKQNFTITEEKTSARERELSFSDSNGVSGTLYVHGDESVKPTTDYALLTVDLPSH